MFEEMKFAFFKIAMVNLSAVAYSFAKALTNGNELMSRNFGENWEVSGSRLQS